MPTVLDTFRSRIVFLAVLLLTSASLSAERAFPLPAAFISLFSSASEASEFLRETHSWVFSEPLEMFDIYGMGDDVSLVDEEMLLADNGPSLFRNNPAEVLQREQSAVRGQSGSSSLGALQGLTTRMVEMSSFNY